MDVMRNPYVPGAGVKPPELAGRDEDLDSWAVALARLAQDRPERGRMLVGWCGVGKTVLLQALRSEAAQQGWAVRWVEVQPEKPLGPALARAIQLSMRPLSPAYRGNEAFAHWASVVRAFSLSVHLTSPWSVGVDVAPPVGIADTGPLDVDLPELLIETAWSLERLGLPGLALFLDELQDAALADLSALCMASHAVSQAGAHLLVVGAGLPHPLRLADARSYAERLFEYRVVDRLDHRASRRALQEPARREGGTLTPMRWTASTSFRTGIRIFSRRTASVRGAWPRPVPSGSTMSTRGHPSHWISWTWASSGRGTTVRPQKSAPTCEPWPEWRGRGTLPRPTSRALRRPPQSLSATRDGLIRKGLVFGAARGRVSFTVPQFAPYILRQSDP